MRRRSKKYWAGYMVIAMAATGMSFGLSMKSNASESSGEAADSSMTTGSGNDICSEMKEEEMLSVELPVVAEGKPSPFDFILDPDGLIYETNAMRYGGGAVEKEATLLFYNQKGEYAFSGCSDKLSIKNQGENPVVVTISASVSELEEIELTGQDDFSENENPAIYLAVIDDRGEERPIFEDEEAIIRAELDSGVYSFGLTGACNPWADWQEVSVHPKVTITWHVESALTGEKEKSSTGLADENSAEVTSEQENFQEGDTPNQSNSDETSENVVPSGEPAESVQGTDHADAPSEDAHSSDEAVSNTSESDQSGEYPEEEDNPEDSADDIQIESDRNDTEKSISEKNASDSDGADTEENISDHTDTDMDEKQEFTLENQDQK